MTRRSQADITKLREAIAAIVQEHMPLTCRHLFYLMVAGRYIEKNETEYKNVVIRLTGEMREEWLARYRLAQWARMPDGDAEKDAVDVKALMAAAGRTVPDGNDRLRYVNKVIPFGPAHIVDNGRWIRKPDTHAGIADAIKDTARFYRRALWAEQPIHVQFFCEKDAIASLVYDETEAWDVPLATIKGDSSKTFLWECAKAIEAHGKPAILYFLGDYDVKGQGIIRSAFERIQRYATNIDISSEVIAITEDQIARYALPTRPEKTDASREAVELDALPPQVLRDLINGAIEQHIDRDVFDVLKAAEESERGIMARMVAHLPQVIQLVEGL